MTTNSNPLESAGVRVRFAPSPTGFFHIGSARTALFNWLYARHTKGRFILRIEDTDPERNTPEALQGLIDGMRWLGLDWDEGPEVGGDYGPYLQSQRASVYQSYLKKLFAADRVYEKDGAVYFRLLGERYTGYDAFKKSTVEKVKAQPRVIEDLVRGRVERAEERDFVIVRQNGKPVFHFVNVVDDIAMGITHVIRGEDHLSNTSKHIELFQAFNAPLPVFAHIPLILKTSGPGKMSKRDQAALIETYRERRFLPEAVRNYLCLLGWSPGDDREMLPFEEIIACFDLGMVNKNNARFDEKKLAFINTAYLRALSLEAFVEKARPVLIEANLIDTATDEDYLLAVLAIIQEKVRSLEDLPAFCGYCFTEDYRQDHKAHQKIFNKGDAQARLREVVSALTDLADFTAEALEAQIKALAQEHRVNTGVYIHATRFAVSGLGVGPGLYALLSVLGKERVIARLQRCLAVQS